MQITTHFRSGRRRPWEARWWVNRKPRSRFFANEKDRDRFLKDFQREIGQHGEEVFRTDPKLRREWLEVCTILPGVSPLALAEHWVLTRKPSAKRSLAQAVPGYLLEMKRAGRDPEYQKHTRRALQRFVSHFGEKTVEAITSQEVSDFLHALPFQALTKRHYRTYLVGAYKWFMRQGWTHFNPAAAVPAPKVHLPEPGLLTVTETESLFRANQTVDAEICGLLALGAFAGLRSFAIQRLAWDELDFKNRAILTPAAKTKKGRRHFIEDLPDNLWAWLEITPRQAFQMTPRDFARRRASAFARAGLLVSRTEAKARGLPQKSPPKNCLRHSFVSYHVALHRDPGRTALLISHKDQTILWNHYLGVATKEDAKRYFELIPGPSIK